MCFFAINFFKFAEIIILLKSRPIGKQRQPYEGNPFDETIQ